MTTIQNLDAPMGLPYQKDRLGDHKSFCQRRKPRTDCLKAGRPIETRARILEFGKNSNKKSWRRSLFFFLFFNRCGLTMSNLHILSCPEKKFYYDQFEYPAFTILDKSNFQKVPSKIAFVPRLTPSDHGGAESRYRRLFTGDRSFIPGLSKFFRGHFFICTKVLLQDWGIGRIWG